MKKVRLVLPVDIKLKDYPRCEGDAIANLSNGTWSVNDGGEGFTMEGKITKRGLETTDVNCCGEGSGNDFEEILKPLFMDYRGDLEAVMVWEGGDSISKISIVKGVVTEKEVKV